MISHLRRRARSELRNPENASWFTTFAVFFEIVSAYGPVGLSLGIPSQALETDHLRRYVAGPTPRPSRRARRRDRLPDRVCAQGRRESEGDGDGEASGGGRRRGGTKRKITEDKRIEDYA
ncbi:hypothetical protein EDB92DRAFT_128238 [Lactarius akahatsu]|uniref:Uncharacterized protein n=1 Tax=Lactarius akahatsu TaxID=416441 RepID=A0AAD4LD16_9AGAM|nr:hypothetical protein EDB92DRAFT_128238 [Lactarius akahatsu]